MPDCVALSNTLETKVTTLRQNLESQMDSIKKDLAEKAKDINPNVDTTGPDIYVGLDFDVRWELVTIQLHLPEVKLVDQKWILDLPQVTMKDQKIIFDIPGVRMVTRKVGEYPEFYCDTSTLIPQCTVRWSPIYADVPETFSQRQEIVLGLPEFRVDKTEMVVGVPEFSMRLQEIKLNLPQFTLKNVSVESEKAKAKAEALRVEGQQRSASAMKDFREFSKIELGGHVTDLFDCFRDQMLSQKNIALAQFEGAISGLESAIRQMAESKVPSDDATLVQANSQLVSVRNQRDQFVTDLQKRLEELDSQQKIAVEKMLASFAAA